MSLHCSLFDTSVQQAQLTSKEREGPWLVSSSVGLPSRSLSQDQDYPRYIADHFATFHRTSGSFIIFLFSLILPCASSPWHSHFLPSMFPTNSAYAKTVYHFPHPSPPPKILNGISNNYKHTRVNCIIIVEYHYFPSLRTSPKIQWNLL